MSDSSPDTQRPIAVTGTLQVQDANLEQRVKAVEDKLASKKSSGAVSFAFDLIKALLPGLVLAIVGYALNDTVSQALRERQLQLDAIKEMKTLTGELQQPTLTREQAQAKAAELASFGEYAVPFFINVEEIGNEYGIAGAEAGLRMVAHSKPKPVCDAVVSVIRNRTGLYKWQTHYAALEVLGAVPCTDYTGDVNRYKADFDSLTKLPDWVAADQPEPREIARLKDKLNTTIDLLNRPMAQAAQR